MQKLESLESKKHEKKEKKISEVPSRLSQREWLPQWQSQQRLTIIKLPFTIKHLLQESNKNLLKSNQLVYKATQQFQLQNQLKSEYVIKNDKILINQMSIIFIQQDYECELSQFPIHILTFPQRFHIIQSIALGLKDLAYNSICHRSLSPSSICLTKKKDGMYFAKINGFDTAIKMVNSSHVLLKGSIVWKKLKTILDYVCPEIKYQQKYSYEADIWSFGVIVNYVLYGTVSNITQSNNQILVDVPKGTPKWLSELIDSMLNFYPEKRYSIETILDILKVSNKFADEIGRFVELGKIKVGEQETNGEEDFYQQSQDYDGVQMRERLSSQYRFY